MILPGKYPYVASPGPLTKAIEQFRKSFPPTVNANTLRKLGLAPNNESYLINTLRFLGLIDEEGQRLDEAQRVFTQHPDDRFAEALEPLVRTAYDGLFDLHGESAWGLSKDELIAFFRNDDGSTAIVGDRQASTFRVLASLAGHGQVPEARKRGTSPRPNSGSRGKTPAHKEAKATEASGNPPSTDDAWANRNRDLGLSVRVEINLPATTDQEVYDKIFRSLRENLFDAGRS